MKAAPATSAPAVARPVRTQGMNWIRQEKRLAIYLRDGLACAYCGAGLESGTQLSLDHLLPYCEGGSNKETNLVTCCSKCNSSRGKRSVATFVEAVAAYLNNGVTAGKIFDHIFACTERPLDVPAAKAIIQSRASWGEALQAANELR